MNKVILSLIAVLAMTPIQAKPKHYESWYQQIWCNAHDGETEVRLWDKTRVDCVTKDYAIEVDFAHKFYQAIGQSLYYSMRTHKHAGVLLIVEKQKDYVYWNRMNAVINQYNLPITTWLITP